MQGTYVKPIKRYAISGPIEFSWHCIHTRVPVSLLLQGLSPHFSSMLKGKKLEERQLTVLMSQMLKGVNAMGSARGGFLLLAWLAGVSVVFQGKGRGIAKSVVDRESGPILPNCRCLYCRCLLLSCPPHLYTSIVNKAK